METSPHFKLSTSYNIMMPTLINESNMILALQAIEEDPSLSSIGAAKIYHISHTTLCRRKKGISL
jgi:hypothetical protein